MFVSCERGVELCATTEALGIREDRGRWMASRMNGVKSTASDCLRAAIIGAVGVLLLLLLQFCVSILYLDLPLLSFVLLGAWVAPAVVALARTRQAGSGCIAGALVALGGLVAGQDATSLLLSFLAYGVAVEVPVALRRYQVWTRSIMIVGGVLGGASTAALAFGGTLVNQGMLDVWPAAIGLFLASISGAAVAAIAVSLSQNRVNHR